MNGVTLRETLETILMGLHRDGIGTPTFLEAWWNSKAGRGLSRQIENRALGQDAYSRAEEWFDKGVKLSDLGKYQEAVACYDRAIDINPGFTNALYNKGAAEDKIGKGQDAVLSYKRFLDLAPPEDTKHIEYARRRLRELRDNPST